MSRNKKEAKRSKLSLFSLVKRNSLAAEMGLVLVIALLVFGITFFIATSIISKEERSNAAKRQSETVINSVKGSIESGIDNYKELSRLIMLNEKVTAFLRSKEVSVGMINDAKYGVMDVMNVSTNLDSVFILRNDGAYMSTGRGEYDVSFSTMDKLTWSSPILERRGGAVILMNAGGAIYRKNGDQVVTVARAIYDIYTQKKTGILLVNISTKMLDEIVNVNSTSDICILSSSGNPLAGNFELSQYYSGNMNLGEISNVEVKDESGWKMISSYSFKDIPLTIITSCAENPAREINTTSLVLIALLIVIVLAMVISAIFINRAINKPIYGLVKAMETTKQSGWLEKIDMEAPNNEIGTLVDSYNSMIEYLNDLFTKLIEKEKSVQRAEMRVLHEQIKPHFLYNSLGTISYMAYDAGATDVYTALETLGSFYRNFLSKGDREITVRREITIIKDYLSLQKLRYSDIIQDEYNIDSEIMECMVPKLMLQPLVENCIYHGIRPKGEPGIIRISGEKTDGGIRLTVYDSGIGMSKDTIDKALGREEETISEMSKEVDLTVSIPSGFGLKGTIDRIRYYCNRDDVVTITSEEGEYTEIVITIPFDTRERGEDDVQSNGD